jgi:hypothetical protein
MLRPGDCVPEDGEAREEPPGGTMTKWRAGLAGRAVRALLVALALGPTPAFADRTSHLFVDETQLLPEGDVELENWVWAQGQIPSSYEPYTAGTYTTGWIWFGPTVGISNHLEMSLPVVVYSDSTWMSLNSISLVARYRFFSREQDDGLQPLLRVEYQQPLSNNLYAGPPTLKVLLAATYGPLTGVRGTVNVGVQLGLPFLMSSTAGCRGLLKNPCSGSVSALGTAALAVSVPLGKEFRIAAELDGQLPLGGEPYPNLAQLYLGPSLAWTRGQIWVTFGTLFGLTNNSYRYVPKVLWGVTF